MSGYSTALVSVLYQSVRNTTNLIPFLARGSWSTVSIVISSCEQLYGNSSN